MALYKGSTKIAAGGGNTSLESDISDYSVTFSDSGDISSYSSFDECLSEINTGSQCSKLFAKIKNSLKYLYASSIGNIQNQISTINTKLNHFNFVSLNQSNPFYIYESKYGGGGYGTKISITSSVDYQSFNMLIFERYALSVLIAYRWDYAGYQTYLTKIHGTTYITVSSSGDTIEIKCAAYVPISILFTQYLPYGVTITETENK